jgi:hypothetical protein
MGNGYGIQLVEAEALLFKNSTRTSKRTPHFIISKINWLMLFKEMIAVYTENNKQLMKKLQILR